MIFSAANFSITLTMANVRLFQHLTPAQDALTVQLEYLIIKRVKNGSNLGLTQITPWVSGLSGSVMLTRLQR